MKFRDRLFPGTPVIYTGMDRRTVPPDAITKNATLVGEDFDLAGLVEDILQIAPDTTNIEVILGATLLERYWAIEFRRAFERFTNRVSFNFLNDLSFDQMLERLAKSPPRSFILLGLLLRDASGVISQRGRRAPTSACRRQCAHQWPLQEPAGPGRRWPPAPG